MLKRSSFSRDWERQARTEPSMSTVGSNGSVCPMPRGRLISCEGWQRGNPTIIPPEPNVRFWNTATARLTTDMRRVADWQFGPCMDGSPLARAYLSVLQLLVGAA